METTEESATSVEHNRIILETITSYEGKTGRVLEAPFMVGDVEKAGHNVLQWERLLPRVKIFYDDSEFMFKTMLKFPAVKCCSELPLLQYLADLGTSFDCASQREIETILDLGVDSTRIIFSHTIKPVCSLKYAEEKKVDLMVFDNHDELDKIRISFPSARLLIRFQCEPSEHALDNFGMKFGCPLNEVKQLLVKAKKENLNVVGVHFHVGSFVVNSAIFNDAIRNAKRVFETAKEIGFEFKILDLGGGFVCGEGMVEFATVAENVNNMLETYFPAEENVRVMAEPGRFLASPVFTWVLKIIGKRSNERLQEGIVFEDGKEMLVAPRFIYYVNDGTYGFQPHCFRNMSTLRPLFKKDVCKDESYPSLVFGPTCDSMDIVYRDIFLPELYIGDWLYATNSGAYSISMATDFNMMPKPIIAYKKDGKINLTEGKVLF